MLNNSLPVFLLYWNESGLGSSFRPIPPDFKPGLREGCIANAISETDLAQDCAILYVRCTAQCTSCGVGVLPCVFFAVRNNGQRPRPFMIHVPIPWLLLPPLLCLPSRNEMWDTSIRRRRFPNCRFLSLVNLGKSRRLPLH
eukprot:4266789-Pyramimonas_sp.AAC.1